jgi:hypothetical protein
LKGLRQSDERAAERLAIVIAWLLSLLLAQAATPGIVTVARGDSSAIEEPKEITARTGSEWEAIWKAHAGSQPVPKVDFSQRMVVAVFLGSRPTAGYAVDIRTARTENGVLTVEILERRPGPEDIVAQFLTSPFHIVEVPRHQGPIQFERSPGTAR